ncbi:MAG: response regulator [Gemmatimonadales bacterium]
MSDTPEPTRTILIVNDHEWSARSIETILASEGYTVVRAYTAEQALARAVAVRPDAFVLDVQLPDKDGLALCEEIRADSLHGPSTPIVVTTAGPSGRKERMAAYRAGAWEFFGQPLDGEALVAKLNVYLAAKAVMDGLRRESLVDARTGLYNEAGLVRRGREMAAEASRRQRPVGCAVLRPFLPQLQGAVDGAERVAGRVAALLRRSGRSADAIGRIGPLDFGVVAVGVGEPELRQLVARMNAAAAESFSPADGPLEFRSVICANPTPAGGDVDLEAMLRESVQAFDRTSGPVAVASLG